MPYNDIINFPPQLDNFPNLTNNVGPQVSEDQIVYAEHYNKIANFINKVEPLLVSTSAASGNMSVFGLGYVFRLWSKIGNLYRVFAKEPADDVNVIQPGNVLPFEFVITASPQTFFMRQNESGFGQDRIIYQVPTVAEVNNTVGAGQNFFTNYPLVSVSIVSDPYPVDGLVNPLTTVVSSLVVNSHSILTAQSLYVRGSIINTALTSSINQANSESWLSSAYNHTLSVSVIVLKRT